jgi:quinol monooxygenase YgiN
MKRILLVAAMLGSVFSISAQEPAQQLYVVTHVDLFNTAAADGAKLLLQFAADSRKETGCIRFEVLREAARVNHLTLLEVWQTKQAFEAHLATPHSRTFREKLQPILGSPFDERLHVILQ